MQKTKENNGHGGKRQGSGRKPGPPKRKVSAMIRTETAAALEIFREREGLTISDAVDVLVTRGLRAAPGGRRGG